MRQNVFKIACAHLNAGVKENDENVPKYIFARAWPDELLHYLVKDEKMAFGS